MTYMDGVNRVKELSLDELRMAVVGAAGLPFPWGIGIYDYNGTPWLMVVSVPTERMVASIGPARDDIGMDIAAFIAKSATSAAVAVAELGSVSRTLDHERGKFAEIRDLVAAHRDEGIARIIDHCLDDPDNPLSKVILDETAGIASDKSTLIAQIACIAAREMLDVE